MIIIEDGTQNESGKETYLASSIFNSSILRAIGCQSIITAYKFKDQRRVTPLKSHKK